MVLYGSIEGLGGSTECGWGDVRGRDFGESSWLGFVGFYGL